MAFYEKLEGAALDAYVKMVRLLKEKAMMELKLPETELVFRPLRPDDLGITGKWTWDVASTAWTTIRSAYTIADNTFVGINGVCYPVERWTGDTAKAISQLRITREASVAREWNIQGIPHLESQTVFVDDPITVDQNTSIKIEAYGISTNSTDPLILHGAVVERRGLVISP